MWVLIVQQILYNVKATVVLIVMMIVGQVSSKEEASEITFIAKLFIVGQRARFLALHKGGDPDLGEDEDNNLK